MRKRRFAICILGLLLLLPGHTFSEPSAPPDGVIACAVSGPKAVASYLDHLTDGDPFSTVTLEKRERLTLTLPDGAAPSGLYLDLFAPGSLCVTLISPNGKDVFTPEAAVGLRRYPLDPSVTEIVLEAQEKTVLSELYAAERELRLPLADCAQADVLILLNEPGDELERLGGLPARFAAQGYSVQIDYFTAADGDTAHRCLAVLEGLGVTNLPYFYGAAKTGAQTAEGVLAGLGPGSLLIRALAKRLASVRPKLLLLPDSDEQRGSAAEAALYRLASGALQNAAENGSAVPNVYALCGANGIELFLDAPQPNGSAYSLAQSLYPNYAERRVYRTALPETLFVTPLTGPAADDPLSAVLDAPAFEPFGPPAPIAAAPVEPEPEETFSLDFDAGHWTYESAALTVTVDRVSILRSKNNPLVYYAADITMRSYSSYRSGVRAFTAPWKFARLERAVLAITGDNLTASEKERKGCLIRQGRFYCDYGKADTLVIDGMTLEVLRPGDESARSLLDRGVRDTYGFGPILVENGEVAQGLRKSRIRHANPRCGIGMVEPGHWIAIVTDGRQRGYSLSISLETFAKLFVERGCVLAYSLDGGSSAGIVFMGEALNRHAGSGADVQRAWTDALLFGYSEQIPSVDQPTVHTGNRR